MTKLIDFKKELKEYVEWFEKKNLKLHVWSFIGWLQQEANCCDKETEELLNKLETNLKAE